MSRTEDLSRRKLVAALGAGLAAAAVPAAMAAQPPTQSIKKYSVKVQRFDPSNPANAEEFNLPVDSPDEEHAASSVLANLISWTPKTQPGGRALPVAFRCLAVTERAS